VLTDWQFCHGMHVKLALVCAHTQEHEASRLREDLRRAEGEANARLSSSSQVAQLRRLLKQKNDMVATLRQRLNR